MSRDVMVSQAESPPDRWEPVRCDLPGGRPGPRVIDVNHKRLEVRYACPKCRSSHTVKVGESA